MPDLGEFWVHTSKSISSAKRISIFELATETLKGGGGVAFPAGLDGVSGGNSEYWDDVWVKKCQK